MFGQSRFRFRANCLALLVLGVGGELSVHAGGWPGKQRVLVSPPQQQVTYTTRYYGSPRDAVQASPMLGSFVPNQSMWVRGNGMMGGGYTPLDQDERDTLSLYGPFSANRGQMKPVRTLQTTTTGSPFGFTEGSAVSYPNYPWRDTLPNLSVQGRAVRPKSNLMYPGWSTDSDTIDQD